MKTRNRVHRNGGTKESVQQGANVTSQSPDTPDSASVQFGFTVRGSRPGRVWNLRVPLPDGSLWIQQSDCDEGDLAPVEQEATRLGISLAQAMNRTWRDAFTAADCGDTMEKARTHKGQGMAMAPRLNSRERALLALLAEWERKTPASFCRVGTLGQMEASLADLKGLAAANDRPRERDWARKFLPRAEALLKGGSIQRSSGKAEPGNGQLRALTKTEARLLESVADESGQDTEFLRAVAGNIQENAITYRRAVALLDENPNAWREAQTLLGRTFPKQ